MELFGRYRLLKPIAAGGMGEIFLARSAGLDGFEKDLVIKRIRPELSANEKFVSMFLDEARVSISLSHQNIVQVFDFGQESGSYFLVMERVLGVDLKAVLGLPAVMGTGLPAGLALYVIGEVLRALDYAHSRRGRNGELLGLVHRDISPDNVMVTFDGAVKVMDFGIAKARGQITQLAPGTVIGKKHYISPETADGGAVDARADIFAAGLVLWELLVGRRAYVQEGPVDAGFYERVLSAAIERPSRANRSLSRGIDKLVMRALARDPKERWQTARDFGDAIQELFSGLSAWKLREEAGAYALERFLAEHRSALGPDRFEIDTQADSAPETVREGAERRFETRSDARSEARTERRSATPTAVREERVRPIERTLAAAIEDEAARFELRPSLWTITRMGRLLAAREARASARACFRAAGVKFAQQGLLAQSLLAARLMLRDEPSPEALLSEIATFPDLVGKSDHAIVPYLFRTGGPVEEMLARLLLSRATARSAPVVPPPLLAQLEPAAFAELAHLAPHRRYEAEEAIVTQGEPGNTMYLILSGRTIISITKPSGERVLLASGTAGDFFGEHSFFSGAPRRATVVAQEPVDVFEIDRALYDRVMIGNARAEEVLDRFYKERIVNGVLATAPLFGQLTASQRRALIEGMTLARFGRGRPLLRRGAPADAVYVIKIGEAEVMTEERLPPLVLGPGAIIGEFPAITGRAAPASIRAASDLEVFQLGVAGIREVLDQSPAQLTRILGTLADQAADHLSRIVAR